ALAQARYQHRRLAQPRARAQQHVELARGRKLVGAAERGDHALARLGAVTLVLDNLQVLALARGLEAEEHGSDSEETPHSYHIYGDLTYEKSMRSSDYVAPQIQPKILRATPNSLKRLNS